MGSTKKEILALVTKNINGLTRLIPDLIVEMGMEVGTIHMRRFLSANSNSKSNSENESELRVGASRMLGSVIVFFICVSFYSTLARAQEIIEVTKSEKIETDDTSSAKQKLMEQAIRVTSLENIRGLIGEEKTAHSKSTIDSKIIANSGKYVLSLRAQNFSCQSSVCSMDTEMKISLKNLRALLLEQGLLYQMEGPPKVLPVIQIVDRIGGRSYGWWYQNLSKEHVYLGENLDRIHKGLKTAFGKIGFYVMSPIDGKFSKSVPESFRGENLQRADYLFLGDFFKSSMIVRGNIILRQHPEQEATFFVDLKFEALHSGNGRLMAEVVRTFETDSGSFRNVIPKKLAEVADKAAEDLSLQLADSWKKGTFGASVLKLAVVGNIAPLELENFRKMIVLQIHDIKALRERIIESNKTTFEVDSSVLPQQLAQSIRAAKFSKFKVEVGDVSSEGLTIKVESI